MFFLIRGSTMPKVLTKAPGFPRRDTMIPPQWPSFTGASQFVGTSSSGRVSVFVDPSLGQDGQQNAQDLLSDADRVVAANDAIFATHGGPVSVIVFALSGATDGTGGADHAGCDFQNGAAIEVCASFGNSARVSALFEAELSECSMGGNLCGSSTGEALSRWCAAETSNNALSDFASAPTWASNGMPDFVNTTEPTDGNPISTECGMAFISWLISQGHTLDKIAPVMVSLGDSGTFARLYANLTGDSAANALPNFMAAVHGLNGGVTNDDPFGGTHLCAELAHLSAGTIAVAGEILAAILADLAAGKGAAQIVANVTKILGSSSSPGHHNGLAASCSSKSHRLLPTQRH